MEYVIIALSALITSSLTLYTGFGLGTVMLPVFALFFPLHIAVAVTALVHVANNLFKLFFTAKDADRSVVLRFGLPAIAAAILGATLLGHIAQSQQSYTFAIANFEFATTLLKMVLAALIGFFAMFELLPSLRALQFDKKYLPFGGVLSGFFGGLSGHQGLLRAAFLAKVDMSPEAYVGTNAVISFLVDLVRISVYAVTLLMLRKTMVLEITHWMWVLTAIVSAFIGVWIANTFLHKVTMRWIQTLVGMLMLVIAVLLGIGIV